MGTRNTPPESLRLFITGGAGTGKSHVISVIKEHLERAHLGACILMAPTGVAAFWPYYRAWSSVNTVVIDEISMVSYRTVKLAVGAQVSSVAI